MLEAQLRDLTADYEVAVKQKGRGVESVGVVYVHKSLARAWIARVLSDVLYSLATRLGVEDPGVAVILVDEPDVEETEADEADEADEGEEGAEGPASL